MKFLKPVLLALFALPCAASRAEFLYTEFLIPSFDGDPNTEYSQWNSFYAPNGAVNYPDVAAPHGGVYNSVTDRYDPVTASSAGFTAPGANQWFPANPIAYWDVQNPTIRQTGASSFIISPGSDGRIYSFSGTEIFEVADTTSYTLGTAVFQFQSEGTAVDFSSIKLIYNNGITDIELSPNEYIREYRQGASSFGGYGNRNALQWDLTGLGITSYRIVFQSQGAHMSFQDAVLDTSASFAAVVPGSRTWTANGAGLNWTNGANWSSGTPSVANGNVRFQNTANATLNLNSNQTVGELLFNTTANVTINGSSTLTANTGITTTAANTGTYRINSNYALGALNIFDIDGGTVELNGIVSGGYGFVKSGAGTLILSNNNTFTGSVGVQEGTLRVSGSNTYSGDTSVLQGNLIVAANAPAGAAGALGNSTNSISLGADAGLYSGVDPAALIIDGNFTVGRNVLLAPGNNEKRLGSMNSSTGATYSGAITFGTAGNVKLYAQNANDRTIFSGAMTGGASSSSVEITGAGTVVYSGTTKAYGNSTTVSSGTLHLASGSGYNGPGNVTVASGANLRVDGTLAGAGTLTLNGKLSGIGNVNRAFTVGANAQVAPGNSVGTLNTAAETWAADGTYLWEIQATSSGEGTGWDFLNITGALSITAAAGDEFTIDLGSLTSLGAVGNLSGFNQFNDYSWRIAAASGGITGFNANKFLIDTSGFLNSYSGEFEVTQTGNNLYLTYTAVPEPSVPLLVLLGTAALCLKRRRS